MATAIQIVGALLVLLGFALSQAGRWAPDAYPYLTVNLVGSLVLTTCAWVAGQWGFVLLNGVWAAFATIGLLRRARGRRHDLISS